MPSNTNTVRMATNSGAISTTQLEAAISAATLEERCEFHIRYERLKQAQSLLGTSRDAPALAVARTQAHELANLIQRLALRQELRELVARSGVGRAA